VRARLDKELKVIDALGYAAYFLAWPTSWATRAAAGARSRRAARLVVRRRVLLGIHDVDPLAHDLYFERFLSLERRDAPDIDLDLCSRRRDEVIDYVYRTYGADRVAMVCTYTTMRPRSALREVGKSVWTLRSAPQRAGRKAGWSWRGLSAERVGAFCPGRARRHRARSDRGRACAGAYAGTIVGTPRRDRDRAHAAHRMRAAAIRDQGLRVTQFDLHGVEQLGLVKIDLLGISALTVVADCVRRAPVARAGLRPRPDPAPDPETSQTLRRRARFGCFQIESPGMRLTLRELAARTGGRSHRRAGAFPAGPLKGGLKDAFVRRHLGHEAPAYLHPALEPVLRETLRRRAVQEQCYASRTRSRGCRWAKPTRLGAAR
jgi:DNA polymerase III alpha subunit